MPRVRSRQCAGLTLLELVVVITIVTLLALLVMVSVGSVIDDSRAQITQSTMRELQTIILNRYVPDMAGVASASTHPLVRKGLPGPFSDSLVPASRAESPQLAFLFINPTTNSAVPTFDPLTKLGWRGPYLIQASGRYPGIDPEGTATARGFTDQYGFASSTPTSNDGDPTVLDGWGNAIVIQGAKALDVILVSAGPDGDLLTTSDNISLSLSLP